MTTVARGRTSSGLVATSANPVTVLGGGTALVTTVQAGGTLTVQKHGYASGTVVLAGGLLYDEASASGTVVSAGGYETVGSGGVEDHATVFGRLGLNGSPLMESAGGRLLNAQVGSGGFVEVFNKTSVSATTVDHGGTLFLDGGTSVDAVLDGGQLVGGGMVSGVTVASGGVLYISGGGSLSRITVSAGGAALLQGGDFSTSASGVTVASGAIFATIGTVDLSNVTIDPGARVVSTGVLLLDSKGLIASSTIFGHFIGGNTEDALTFAEEEYVLSGGTAVSAMIGSGGVQVVYSGGTARGTFAGSGSFVFLDAGSVDHAVADGGAIQGQGTATGLVVMSGGLVNIQGSVTGATLEDGNLGVSGTASGTIESAGYVFLGGSVSDTVIYGGSARLGGTVVDTTITGGMVDLISGTAADTRVSGATVRLLAGSVSGTVIGAGGTVLQTIPAGSGTTFATGTTIASGGRLVVGNARADIAADTQDTKIEAGGQIDLATVAYTHGATAKVKDHMLVVNAGGGLVKLGVVGDYAGASFLVTSDGTGGTLVTLQAASGGMAVPLSEEVASAGAHAIAHDVAPAAIRPAGGDLADGRPWQPADVPGAAGALLHPDRSTVGALVLQHAR